MSAKRNTSLLLMIGLVLTGLIFAVALVASSIASSDSYNTSQVSEVQIDSAYGGEVKLDWALPGVYSDTLPTPTPGPGEEPPDLGAIDLGLLLYWSEEDVVGYIDLENTLVFTAQHTITPTINDEPLQIAVGPMVSGTLDGETLHLESERFTYVTGAGQQVMRQFQLISTEVVSPELSLEGSYRETIWGYGLQPVTVLGSFSLQRHLLPGPSIIIQLGEKVYLPLIVKD